MKKLCRILCAVMVLCMLLTVAPFGAFAEVAAPTAFRDLDNWAATHGKAHWAESYIYFWANEPSADGTQNVILGYPNGDGTYDFKPDANIIRGEVAAILDRVYGFDRTGAAKAFGDVPKSYIFFDPIMECADNGVIKGYGDAANSFCPNKNITRQEAIALIARCAMAEDDYAEFSDAAANLAFLKDKFPVDADQIPAFFYPEFCFLAKYGNLEGCGDGSVMPARTITRAEFVKLLYAVSHDEPIVKDKVYQLDITIADNKGNTVSDKAEFLTNESNLMLTVLPLCIVNRGNFAANFPSSSMRDILDEGIAIYNKCNADGWTVAEKDEWNAFIDKYFDAVGGNTVFKAACGDFESNIDVFSCGETYSITFTDRDADRLDYVYTVTVVITEMNIG